jgi:hypothetical protein
VSGAPMESHLRHAMTLVRLAQGEKHVEMIYQHLREIERLIEYCVGNLERSSGEAKTQ